MTYGKEEFNMMFTGRKLRFLMMLLAAFAFHGSLTGLASAADLMEQEASPADYAFTIQKGMLKMTDGVKLAVTYYKPTAKTAGETFPVVLEMLPYRKDDIFYLGDYQYGSYFAKRGYVLARVDVRGTGGSKGTLPDREYSDAELSDAVEVISQLSQMEWSNGNIGMYGISWSGFNSLMVAHRKPPALKAIIAAHATDDLFYNDVHYIDGVLHMDYYAEQIDTDNALPRSPGYKVDETWYKERFDREPWLFTWFREQQDGPFWRRESLRFKSPLEVPAYLIGGLLDGYRDFVTHIFQHSTAPVIAEIGPWNHAYPEEGKPGPNYEWRRRALRWWDYWLKGLDTGILNERRFMVFVRDGHEPSTFMEEVPGDWRCEQTWPIEGSTWKRLHPSAGHLLGRTPSAQETSDTLVYRAGIGMAAGGWWGDQTSDMSADDSQSLVYDSEELTETVEIIGMPQVSLRVEADAPLYQWTVRLEDVSPTGKATLVSGALINPSQRFSRLDPQALIPGKPTTLTTGIHFTTWRFKPGHRIRLSVANAQFPMAWPTPTRGTTTLFLGTETWIELPVPPASTGPLCVLPVPEKDDDAPDGETVYSIGPTSSATRDEVTGNSLFTTSSDCVWRIKRNYFNTSEFYEWSVNDATPANAKFEGHRRHVFSIPGNGLDLSSQVTIQSDESYFHITFTKTLFRNGKLVRKKTWSDRIRRLYQ